MVTGERDATPPLWPVEARLAALLPDLLVFRKSRGLEPELATAQGVLLGVHVTGFTALMDRFSLTCKSERDMDKLAHIFSYYISDIVEHGGSASLLRLQEELSLPQTEVLEFGVPLLRAAAWELWPKEQQITLHLECACFLQVLACRCGSCHGGDFVPVHRFAVCSTKNSKGTSRFCTYRDTGSVLTQIVFSSRQNHPELRRPSQVNAAEAFFYLRKASSLPGQPSAFSFLKKQKVKICQFEEATFCHLLSEVCVNMGHITLAKKLARKALRLLKRNFRWTWFGVLFQTFLEKCWHSCTLSQPPNDPSENKKNLAVLQ
ncbi:adenylate cyclase type 10-like [Symphalangus syndactylus]|uniref:adenylate cyclase type 10-like n=1 Tax=Symphalangus syndactylus TaxID=9590 RepID=UPI00300524A7